MVCSLFLILFSLFINCNLYLGNNSNKSTGKMFRQELDDRIEKLKTACERANASVALILKNAYKLVDPKNLDGDASKTRMEMLQQLDSLTYPVIEFNICVDLLELQVSETDGPASDVLNIKTENILPSNEESNSTCTNTFGNAGNIASNDCDTFNTPHSQDININVEDGCKAELVCEPPGDFHEDVSEVSAEPLECTIRMHEKSTATDDDSKTDDDTVVSEDSVANITCILQEFQIDDVKNEMTFQSDTIQMPIKQHCDAVEYCDVTLEKDTPDCKIPDQPLLDLDEDFIALVKYVESPSHFYITRESSDFQTLQLDMLTHYNEYTNRILFSTKEKLMSTNKIYFACNYAGLWLRGKLMDILESDDTHIGVFLMDTGHTVRKMHIEDIEPLKRIYCSLPPQAYRCHLNGIQPVPKDNGKWSKKAINYMKNISSSCNITVTDNEKDSYEVCVMTMDSITVNIQLIEDDLAVLKESCDRDEHKIIEMTVDCSKATRNQSETSVVPNFTFEKGLDYNCFIMYVDSPSKFYIVLTKNHHELFSMIENMTTVCNTDNTNYLSKREILDCEGSYYACYFRDEWLRGIISDPLNDEPDYIEMFLIDVGCNVRYHFSKIKFLNKQFYILEPQAYACHLFQVRPPLLTVTEEWPLESKKFMRRVENTVGNIIIASMDDQSLGVYLITSDGIEYNVKIVEERLAVVPINYDDSYDLQSPIEFPKMAPTNDLFNDFVADLQGFSSHHDLELCKNYTGPPKTTCFKGSRCKKIHQLPNKDGWTLKKVYGGSSPHLFRVYPTPDSMIMINVTAVTSCCEFYGHIMYFDEGNQSADNLKASQRPKQPKELTDLMNQMNSERVTRALVPLSSLPNCSSLVLCLVPSQGKWCRGLVVQLNEMYSATVFLVDYGIEHTVSYKQMRKLDGIFTQLPYQAMKLGLANAECDCNRRGISHDGMGAFFDIATTKDITGYVVSSNSEQVDVVLYNADLTDIGEFLCQKGLLKPLQFKVQDYSQISEDVNKIFSNYTTRRPLMQEQILYASKKFNVEAGVP